MSGFQVGRMTGNPLVQGFQVGSSIKQAKLDEAFRLKEHARLVQQQNDLQEYRLRQENRADLQNARAYETQKINDENLTLTNDGIKSELLTNQVLDSGRAYLGDNVFNEFGENEAENFFTKNDDGEFIHNESFDPQSYGYGVSSTKTLDRTVEYLSQQDAYKDMDPDKIRGIISKNWEDGEGSQNIFGDQRDELFQNSTSFIQKAFMDDIKGLDADGINEVKKLYGTNQNAFNMITPGLDAAGQNSDQYNIALGGEKVAFNMNPNTYDRNAALLQNGYYKENADGSFEYKPYDIKVPGSEKEAKSNKAEEILNQPYDSTTYSKVRQLGVNLEEDTNARQLYFGNLGREYQGYDATVTGIGVSPLEFNREGTKVSVNLDTMLDIGGDDMTYDIKYDKTGAPYFNFSPVIDDYDNKTYMSILTTGLASKPNNEIPTRKIYLDDSWVKEGAKSLTDYINRNMEANMPGMNNLFGGLSF